MPYIENVSMNDVQQGWHTDFGDNAVLIQIGDPGFTLPESFAEFAETHQYYFMDAEKPSPVLCIHKKNLISREQAFSIANVLMKALYENRSIIVHCHAGICRSGAVVEVASMIGFTPTNRNMRIPNVLVKKRLMQALGLSYED